MCPNCGADETALVLRSGYSGDGFNEERLYEEWLECAVCGKYTTADELRRLEESK